MIANLGLGILNKAGVPIAIKSSACTGAYPASSNGWCFDSTNDWFLYGNLPEFQVPSNPSPVAAQQIALANAKAAGLTPLTTVIVQGGGAGVASATKEALAPGVTVNMATGAIAVQGVVQATAPPVVSSGYATPLVTSSGYVASPAPAATTPPHIITGPVAVTPGVPTAASNTPPAIVPGVPNPSSGTSVTAANPSAPSVTTPTTTTVQAADQTPISWGPISFNLPFTVPNLAVGGFTSQQVWLGVGIAGALLLLMAMQSGGRRF